MPLRWLGLSAGATALAVSGLFGGLQGTDRPELPAAQVGKVDHGSPWNVSVTRVRMVSDLTPIKPATAGNDWLAVVATVEITADESRNDLADIVRVTGADGLTTEKPGQVILMRDSTRLGHLNPGIPEELAFVWERSATAAAPTRVTVQIYGKTHRLDSLGNRMEWLDPAVRAEVVVPVQDRRT